MITGLQASPGPPEGLPRRWPSVPSSIGACPRVRSQVRFCEAQQRELLIARQGGTYTAPRGGFGCAGRLRPRREVRKRQERLVARSKAAFAADAVS